MKQIELRAPETAVRIYKTMQVNRKPEDTERLLVARAARAEKEAAILGAMITWARSLGLAAMVLLLVLFSFGLGGTTPAPDIREIVRPATPKPEAPRLPARPDNVRTIL